MILVTDDAAFMRMTIKRTLSGLGYEIEEATNGREAIEKVRENDYQLVMLDITMPDVDGIQALIEIQKMKPNQLCVMCSAMGQEAMVVEAIKQGAKDFIVKPFKPERLEKMVKSLNI